MIKSIVTKIVGTMIIGVIWFAFIVLYLAFYASSFNLWQKAAIFLASGAIVTAIVVVLWIRWAMNWRKLP